MWRLSKGQTIASNRAIAIHESQVVLSKLFPQILVRDLRLIATGAAHALGMPLTLTLPPVLNAAMERALVTGEALLGHPSPPRFLEHTHRRRFQAHLAQLRAQLAENLPPERWDDGVYAIVFLDVIDPFCSVLWEYGLGKDAVESIGPPAFRQLVDSMPTRRLDAHLHRQVLRNPQYMPKEHDLEDWAALCPAAMYRDVVVCEKHFKDLSSRDGFQTKALILDDLAALPSVADGWRDDSPKKHGPNN